MKTAHDYLRPYVGPEPGPYLAYVDAVKVVETVLAELNSLRDAVQDAQVSCEHMEGKPLADERAEYRRLGRNEMRARLLTQLPRRTQELPPRVFAPSCPRCLLRRDQCVCPPLFPENPLF